MWQSRREQQTCKCNVIQRDKREATPGGRSIEMRLWWYFRVTSEGFWTARSSRKCYTPPNTPPKWLQTSHAECGHNSCKSPSEPDKTAILAGFRYERSDGITANVQPFKTLFNRIVIPFQQITLSILRPSLRPSLRCSFIPSVKIRQIEQFVDLPPTIIWS